MSKERRSRADEECTLSILSAEDIYLQEISRIPLLTRSQEAWLFILSKRCDVARDFLSDRNEAADETVPNFYDTRALLDHDTEQNSKIIETIRNYKSTSGHSISMELLSKDIIPTSLTSDAPTEQLQESVLWGVCARDHLLNANLRWVVTCAKHWLNNGVPLMDLIQHGNIGLQTAITKFKMEEGNRLTTYATRPIITEIKKALLSQRDGSLNRPNHFEEDLKYIRSFQKDFYLSNGKNPNEKEIAAHILSTTGHKVSLRRIKNILLIAQKFTSLDRPLYLGSDEEQPLEIEDDKAPTVEDQTIVSIQNEELYGLITNLTPDEQRIITLRFGIHATNDVLASELVGVRWGQKSPGLTLEETARLLGRNEKVLRADERIIKAKLRTALEKTHRE